MQVPLAGWEERIRSLLGEEGAELVDAVVQRGRGGVRLRLFVDREEGIGIEELARLSKRIGMTLDADPAMAGRYELEVSSPGMNRPVRTEAHFRRFAGERVHLWTARAREERRHFEGTILGCVGGVVSVQVDGLGAVEFPLESIERAELRLDPKRPPRRREAEPGTPSREVRENGE